MYVKNGLLTHVGSSYLFSVCQVQGEMGDKNKTVWKSFHEHELCVKDRKQAMAECFVWPVKAWQ